MQNEIMKFARYFRIFSNRNRFKIIEILGYSADPLCVGDLAKRGNIPMSKISDQLMVLRKEDIVNCEKKSTKVFYSLNKEKVRKILDDYIHMVRGQLQSLQAGAAAANTAVAMKPLVSVTARETTQDIQFDNAVTSTDNVREIFAALANETRCEALVRLAEKEQFVNEMCEKFYLEQPTVSLHLNMLKKVGLVDSHKKSLKVYYNLKFETLEKAIESFLK